MPKRMLDSSLLTSPSLSSVSPRAQDAFPRFILLADDFGCFDANTRVLLGRGWPYRTDVSEEEIAAWLDEYETVGMLEKWEEGGRTWAFLTGWTGPHGQRRREEYDPNGTPAQRRGSKRYATPPLERKRKEIHSRGGPAAEPPRTREVPAPAVPDPDPDPDAVRAERGSAAGGPTNGSGGGRPELALVAADSAPVAIPVTLSPAAERWPLGERLRIALSDRFSVVGANGSRLAPPKTAVDREQLERDVSVVGFDSAFAVCVEHGVAKGAGAGTRSIAFFTGRLHDFATAGPSASSSANGSRPSATRGPFASP